MFVTRTERFEWLWRRPWLWFLSEVADRLVHTTPFEKYRCRGGYIRISWVCRACVANWHRIRELANRRNNDPRWGLR